MVTELEKLSEQFSWKTGNMSINIAFINYSCSHYLGASVIQRAFALKHKNEKTCFLSLKWFLFRRQVSGQGIVLVHGASFGSAGSFF